MDPLLQQLWNDGVDLDAPRNIDHHIVGSIPIISALFVACLYNELEKRGCKVQVNSGFIEASETISPKAAAAKRDQMRSLCARHLHNYDGWGTSIDIRPRTD